MAEYIEREAILREIERRERLMVGDKTISVDALKRFILNRPAADVAPVQHGRWRYFHKQNIAVCTECSFERDLDTNFGRAVNCPNCGAKMDGDDSDNVDAIVDCVASVCPSGGHHDYRMVAIGSDEVGDPVNTYRCSKCGEEFKVKFVT